MTRIDRYMLYLFLRTVFVCFCSIAGIFVVFHAFASMDDLVKQGEVEGGLFKVMVRYYGPYMLLLFDWTGTIIALMALLFTVGWVRRIGELTAVLSTGVSHGRIFRPMLIAACLLLVVPRRFYHRWRPTTLPDEIVRFLLPANSPSSSVDHPQIARTYECIASSRIS